MQAPIQHQAMEDIYGLLQLLANRRHHRREDLHHARRPEPRSQLDKDITGWSENDRGVSFTFGPDVVSRFLQKHDMDLICRAHQVVEDGYEFFSKRQLVTLFSAPNYCGEFDNAGAMMSVDESLLCSFQV